MEKGKSASEDAGPEGGWIVMSHIGWGGEQNTFYKGMETSPSIRVLKSLEGRFERESPKRTMSASGGSRPLQKYKALLRIVGRGVPRRLIKRLIMSL